MITDKENKLQIMKLNEGSWFGDYQILFEINSNFNFIADPSNSKKCWIMQVDADIFMLAATRNTTFNYFLRERALLRRNAFIKAYKARSSFMKEYDQKVKEEYGISIMSDSYNELFEESSKANSQTENIAAVNLDASESKIADIGEKEGS